MSSITPLVKDFLAQKNIAVVGVSDKRETGCNLAYLTFKKKGYQVTAVNPRMTTFQGDPCYPDLASIPEKPDAVFILSKPEITDQIVQQCVDLGVKHVWMHCFLGAKSGSKDGGSSVSQDAVAKCKANGIAVIPGSCPNQWLGSDVGHSAMRVIFNTIGMNKLD